MGEACVCAVAFGGPCKCFRVPTSRLKVLQPFVPRVCALAGEVVGRLYRFDVIVCKDDWSSTSARSLLTVSVRMASLPRSDLCQWWRQETPRSAGRRLQVALPWRVIPTGSEPTGATGCFAIVGVITIPSCRGARDFTSNNKYTDSGLLLLSLAFILISKVASLSHNCVFVVVECLKLIWLVFRWWESSRRRTFRWLLSGKAKCSSWTACRRSGPWPVVLLTCDRGCFVGWTRSLPVRLVVWAVVLTVAFVRQAFHARTAERWVT